MSAVEQSHDVRRDGWIITLVSAAHYLSHVMQLALPPLFPILHQEFDVSFIQLGLVMTVFYSASGTGQAVAGVLVDRYGAHRLLIAGLAALSIGIALLGLSNSYLLLLPLALIAGLGNSVFHPADLSILSLRVSERRHGRAFAVHGIAGALGYATSPVLIAAVAATASWRVALVGCGVVGLIATAVLYANRQHLVSDTKAHAPRPAAAAGKSGYLAAIASPVVLLGFAYFAMTSFAGQGVQSFGTTSFVSGYGLMLSAATLCVSAYLIGNACGIVTGGFLADRTHRHHIVAMTGILVAGTAMVVVTSLSGHAGIIAPVMFLSGMAYGITQPSRDVLIRKAAAGVGLGRVFGFVYSGFDLGSSTAPLLFGALLDHQAPRGVFLAIAVALALAAPTVIQVRRQVAVRAEAAVAAD